MKRLVPSRVLSEAERAEAAELLAALEGLQKSNPLQFFEPHSPAQREFFEAQTAVVAAFAGNRFGKTTSLVVRILTEMVDRDCLPEFLASVKRFDAPVHAWVVCPTNDKLYDSLLPAFEKWCPAEQYRGGVFAGSGGAWSKERRMLSFANGSSVAFKTYEQHASTLGGAALHVVGYDEPPPREHREECMTRLLDYGGYELFAMTPLKTNTGWIRRDIFKQRESPDITVVRGSMHDNPTLDKATVARSLEAYASDLWRRAREFGDFVDVGGLIYPDFERSVVESQFAPDLIRNLDVVVGIDPGIKNAAFIWVGFDRDNTGYVFDEALLQNRTPADYAVAIRDVNSKWGLRDVSYVIDPNAATRAAANAEDVDGELSRRGIYCGKANNRVDAGLQQVRVRMQHGRLLVSPDCRGLRDEADEYAAEDRDDGEFKVIKQNDHRLDALRYAVMTHTWDPVMEMSGPAARLGWSPDHAPDLRSLVPFPSAGPPMGSMS